MPNALDRPDYEQAVRKIAKQVRLYIEHVWPMLEKRGGVPETPFNRKERGQSSPAIPEKGLEAVEDNAIPSGYFTFHLEFFEKGAHKTEEGVLVSGVLKEARDSPAAVGNWLAGETGEMRAMRRALIEVSRRVAKGVLFVHPDVNPDEIRVAHGPKGARSLTQASAQDRERTQEGQRARANRLRYAQLLEIRRRHPDATQAASWQMWADEKVMGVSTIRDAERFCTKHEWPDGRSVRPELRWPGSEEERAAA